MVDDLGLWWFVSVVRGCGHRQLVAAGGRQREGARRHALDTSVRACPSCDKHEAMAVLLAGVTAPVSNE